MAILNWYQSGNCSSCGGAMYMATDADGNSHQRYDCNCIKIRSAPEPVAEEQPATKAGKVKRLLSKVKNEK